MKRATLLLVILLTVTSVFGQTNYINGFNTGYKKGYCQDQGIGCIPPIPPIAPISKIGESSDSYTDGYNRGFQMGLNARQSIESSNSNVSYERTRYKTSDPEFLDYMLKPQKNSSSNSRGKIYLKIINSSKRNIFNKNYDEAIYDANTLIKLEPKLAVSYQLKSIAQFKKGLLIEAYNNAIKATDYSDNESFKMWSQFINEEMSNYLTFLMSKENYTKIIKEISNISNSTNSTNYFCGLAFYYLQEYNKSKKYLKKVKNFRPANAFLESIKDKNYIENPFISKDFIDTSPRDSIDLKKLFKKVNFLYQKKEYNSVIAKLKPIEDKIKQKVITDKKIIFTTYSLLSYSHYKNNDLTETIKYTSQAINNSASKEIGNLFFIRGISKSNIGDYYGSNNDFDYLIENYNKINYNSNQLPTLYNNKAYNLVLLKKYKDAKPLIEKALSMDKNTGYIWETKGELEYYLGNYSNAVNAMSKSIKIKSSAISYYFKGLSEIKLGNIEIGCSDLSKAGEMGEKKAYDAIRKNCN